MSAAASSYVHSQRLSQQLDGIPHLMTPPSSDRPLQSTKEKQAHHTRVSSETDDPRTFSSATDPGSKCEETAKDVSVDELMVSHEVPHQTQNSEDLTSAFGPLPPFPADLCRIAATIPVTTTETTMRKSTSRPRALHAPSYREQRSQTPRAKAAPGVAVAVPPALEKPRSRLIGLLPFALRKTASPPRLFSRSVTS